MRSHSERARAVMTLANMADELTRQKSPPAHVHSWRDHGRVPHPGAAEYPTTIIDAHFATGDQPCQAFCRGDDNPHDHYCATCDGLRAFCANCNRDHHEAGWETCKPGAYAEPDHA